MNNAAAKEALLKAIDSVTEEIRKYLGFETLETRNLDSLDFHEVSVWKVRTIIELAFEAGRAFEANEAGQKIEKKRKPRNGKRFHLLHVYGGTDPEIRGKSHKDYESLLRAAKKFFKSDDFTEGEDGLFYTVTIGKTVQVCPFDSSDLEDEN